MEEVRREMDAERNEKPLMEGGGINYAESISDVNVNNNEKNKKKKKGENFIGDYYQVTYISKRTLKNPYLEKKKKRMLKKKALKMLGWLLGKNLGINLLKIKIKFILKCLILAM